MRAGGLGDVIFLFLLRVLFHWKNQIFFLNVKLNVSCYIRLSLRDCCASAILPSPITACKNLVWAPVFLSLGGALCWITPPFSFNLNFRTYQPSAPVVSCHLRSFSPQRRRCRRRAVGVVVCTTEVRLVNCCELRVSLHS